MVEILLALVCVTALIWAGYDKLLHPDTVTLYRPVTVVWALGSLMLLYIGYILPWVWYGYALIWWTLMHLGELL